MASREECTCRGGQGGGPGGCPVTASRSRGQVKEEGTVDDAGVLLTDGLRGGKIPDGHGDVEIPADLRNKLLLQDEWAGKTCLKSLRRRLEMSRTFTRTLAGKAKRIRAATGAGWNFFSLVAKT